MKLTSTGYPEVDKSIENATMMYLHYSKIESVYDAYSEYYKGKIDGILDTLLLSQDIDLHTKDLILDEIKSRYICQEIERKKNDSIDILDLSIRPLHTLKRNGITKISELRRMTDAELLKTVRGFGKKSLTEVRQKMEEYAK